MKHLYIVEELVHGVLELCRERLVGGLVGHARVNVEVPAHNGEICRGALHQLHHLLRLQKIAKKKFYFLFFIPLFNTVSSAARLCESTLVSHPGQLRLRHWLSDALTTRLDLIHKLG
jgi:hypothetical protein